MALLLPPLASGLAKRGLDCQNCTKLDDFGTEIQARLTDKAHDATVFVRQLQPEILLTFRRYYDTMSY